MLLSRQQALIAEARWASTMIITAQNKFNALQREITASGGQSCLTEDAFTGQHAGLTAAAVVAAVYTTGDVIDAALVNGHDTNLYALHEA